MTDAPIVSHPLVTIGVPFFNEERYLEETLASLRDQSHGDFAVLMSDNCSTDGSADIAKSFAASDPRFHLARQSKNSGAFENFHFCFAKTQSTFLMWLGAHDLLHESFLAQHVAALNCDKRLSLSYSLAQIVDVTGDDVGVIGDSRLADIFAPPAMRYIQVPRYGRGYLVNNLFRRSLIADFAFEICPIWDCVLLSHAIYKGGFNYIAEPLYIQRDIHPPGSERMDDVVARVGQTLSQAPVDMIVEAYMNDFRKVAPRDPMRNLMAPVLSMLLKSRYEASPSAITKALRTTLDMRRRLITMSEG